MKSKVTKRVEVLRVKRAKLGIARTEFYVHADDRDIVKEFVQKLNAKREEQSRLLNQSLNESVEDRLKRQADEARQKFAKVLP